MSSFGRGILKGVGWTVGAFVLSQLLRLVTIVIMARFLSPELFGIMAIVNSLRTGVDLVSDVGISQNIIHNKNADDPRFYNTAWTLQLIRGFVLWVACSLAAVPLAHFFDAPTLAFVLPVAAFYFVILGFSSVSIFLLQRRLQLVRLNIFDLVVEFVSASAHLLFSYLSPTIWALVFGGLVSAGAKTVGSYFVLRNMRQSLYVSKAYVLQIFSFGKWIFIATLLYFLSTNFDRLFLGKAGPLAMLGVYGIARSLSDPIGALVVRICSYVVFPVMAAKSGMERASLRMEVASTRMKLLLLAALGLSLFTAMADLPVKILYDERYQDAAWMLPLMSMGIWFSIICSLNETTLLGFGQPQYGAIANSLKFAYLCIFLPLGFNEYGTLGAVVVISLSDWSRYIPILLGQKRERFSFGLQDLVITLILLALTTGWETLRWAIGYGTSFDGLPLPRLT